MSVGRRLETAAGDPRNTELLHWQNGIEAYPIARLHLALLQADPDRDLTFRRHLTTKVMPRLKAEGRFLTVESFASRLALFTLGGELPP